MTRFLLLAAACALSGLSLSSCIVYDPQLVGRDGGRDTGPSDCTPRRAPARPTTADSADVPEVAFGLRQVSLNQGSEWETIGFDLDGYCTGAPDFLNECDIGGPRARDGNDGIDNVFGQNLYPLVEAAVPGLEDMAVAAQEEGRGMPVLRIRQWNGTPNDPQVEIVIAQAVFGTSAEAPGGGAPAVTINSPIDFTLADGSPLPLPSWNTEDYLWLRSDAFLAGDLEQPLIVDRTAYIVDGVFVARLPDRIDIIFPTDDLGVLVRLTNAVATGTLSPDGSTLSPVVVAGRWRIADLLSTAENIGLCRDGADGRYALLENRLSDIADVLSMQPEPGDPVVPCDAVSIGVTFLGSRARIAATTPGLPLVNVCAGSGTDAGVMSDAGMMSSDAGVDAGVDAGEPDAGVDAGG